jgi:HSP20 family molecular chaperone IbpA
MESRSMEPNELEEHKESKQFVVTLPIMIAALVTATAIGAVLALGLFTPKEEPIPQTKTSLFRTDGDESTQTLSSPQSTQHPPVGSDPFGSDPFQAMRQRMEALMNRSIGLNSNVQAFQFSQPQLNMDEDDFKYTIRVHMPGMEDGSLEVNIEGQHLKISSQLTVSSNNSSGTFQSISTSHFNRAILLPQPVRPQDMTTEYKDDVLIIHVPKQEDD